VWEFVGVGCPKSQIAQKSFANKADNIDGICKGVTIVLHQVIDMLFNDLIFCMLLSIQVESSRKLNTMLIQVFGQRG